MRNAVGKTEEMPEEMRAKTMTKERDILNGSSQANPGRTRHSTVVHQLGERIVRGGHRPGETIPTEGELAEEFQVGRSALRESVKILMGKGLLESRTSAGTRIRPRESWNLLDPDVLEWRYSGEATAVDIKALANLRVVLEPGAAGLAATEASPAQRRMVAIAMADLWATVDDIEAFVQADLAFHRSIFVAANNDLLLYVHDVVSVAFGAIRPLHTHSPEANKSTLPNHEAVAVAIQRGHHRKAEEAMRTVVQGARGDVVRAHQIRT